MRNIFQVAVSLALLAAVSATAFAGPWHCRRARSSTGTRTVITNDGGSGGGAAPSGDPNASVSPEVAEEKARAEFEEELGERLIAALVAKFGKQLVDNLIDGDGGVIDDVGSLLSNPCRPSAGAGAGWQQDVLRLQSQIDTINTKLGISAQPELAVAGGRVDAKLVAAELARQQREDAEAALAEFRNRVTESKIQERERTLEAKQALDAELEAVNQRLRNALDGDAPQAPSVDPPKGVESPPSAAPEPESAPRRRRK